MSGPELKPCPFCGGSASFERKGDRRASTIVRCDVCGCSHECGEQWGHGRAWNTRAAMAEVQAIVADAVEIARAQAFVLGREAGENAEREACARLVDCGCDKRQKAAVIEAKTSAERARACGQYNCGAEDADAIRKRGEG